MRIPERPTPLVPAPTLTIVAARVSCARSRVTAMPSDVRAVRWSGVCSTATLDGRHAACAAGFSTIPSASRHQAGPKKSPTRTRPISALRTGTVSVQGLVEHRQPEQVASRIRRPANHEEGEGHVVRRADRLALPDSRAVTYALDGERGRSGKQPGAGFGYGLGPHGRGPDRGCREPLLRFVLRQLRPGVRRRQVVVEISQE